MSQNNQTVRSGFFHPNASLLNIGNYDGKRVRITEANGEVFEGVAAYYNKDYCEHEYGRREPCLQIANFTFFRSDVKAIETLRGQYAAPYGRIEELNFQDGIDSIEQIEQMNFAYVYDPATHSGTLTAAGVDENNNPINYQIAFTYSDNDDTITINLLFANAEDEDTTISFPLVFHRDI